MKSDIISTRIEHDLKIEFSSICKDIGLSPSQAIKLFAKAVINHGGIPFELKARQPNQLTIQAMQELETSNTHKTQNSSTLFSDLDITLK